MAMPTDKLITAKEAADMLGLNAKTLLGGRCDTDELTRIRVGKRGVRFSRLEVQAMVLRLVNEARQHRREEEEKEKARRQCKLRLVPPSGDLANRIVTPFRK